MDEPPFQQDSRALEETNGAARRPSAGLCNEFGAAAFDEIAGLRNDALDDFENLSHAGFTVYEFGEGFEKRGVM
jgi:hypothetical protein